MKKVWVFAAISTFVFTSGCTNWKQRYEALNVEHENLKGRYDMCMGTLDVASADKDQLSRALTASQKTIEDLQRQIKAGQTAGQASGFGDGMDVSFDSAAGTITVTLPNEILFAPGQASLRGTTSRELDHVRSVVQDRYRGKLVDVVGHTDSDPIKKTAKLWKDNWELSAQRALTVLRYLNDKGLPADKVRAVACGQSRPVASNSTSAGKAKNRRVEIVVHMR